MFRDLEKDGPRDLFPKFYNTNDINDRTRYVEQVMLDLLEASDLYLTECMAQGTEIMDVVGNCILGFRFDRDTGMQSYQSPPMPVETAKIKFKLMGLGEKQGYVDYKDGMVEARSIEIRSRHLNDRRNKKVRIEEPRWYRLEPNDEGFIVATMRQAYKLIKQRGKWIKYAGSTDMRYRNWHVEEVPMNADKHDDNGDEKPKRPPVGSRLIPSK